MAMFAINLVQPQAAAQPEFFFNKPASKPNLNGVILLS